MKKTLVIAVLIIAAFSSGVSADEKSHREAALKMMEMFNMRLLYNQAVGSVYQASM